MPFNERVISDLFDGLAPCVAGVSEKRLKNAHSDARYVLERYRLGRRRLRVSFSEPVAALNAKLARVEQWRISKLFAFLSMEGIDPEKFDATHVDRFRAWLTAHAVKYPHRCWRQSLLAWNRAQQVAGWPQRPVEVPSKRKPWALPWSAFPASLEASIDAFLRAGDGDRGLFGGDDERPVLRPATIATQKEQLRCVASSLALSGVPPADLRGLRDLCTPERYRRSLEFIAARAGKTNRTLDHVSRILTKVAKYGGVLSEAEQEEVIALRASVLRKVKAYLTRSEDRDQELLDKLDDPALVDALLALPSDTARAVLDSGRRGYREAIRVQMALVLEIWLCAPLRLVNIRHLRLDQHFFELHYNNAAHVVLRIPAAEVKNRTQLEHFLTEEAVWLLGLYLETFLPILTRHNPSPYLFPGRNGKPKAAQVFRTQTSRFVNAATKLKFHPHAIRKVAAKLYLDLKPEGMSVAARVIGDSETMTRKVYGVGARRAATRAYTSALEARRLSSFRPLGRRRSKKGG